MLYVVTVRQELKRLLAVTCSLMALCIGLTSCSTTTPPKKAVQITSPKSTTVNAKALKAVAERQFTAYFRTEQVVLRAGGHAPNRLKNYVTPAQYKNELVIADELRSAHRRLVGAVSFRNFTLQDVDRAAGTFSAYVCLDNEDSKLVDHRGNPVHVAGRGQTTTMLLKFKGLDRPKLNSGELWRGSSVC